MKVYMKPLEMIATFTPIGKAQPYRFKLPGSETVVKVDHIDFSQEEKLAGNKMLVYRCRSIVNEVEKIYELKYELATCFGFFLKCRASWITRRLLSLTIKLMNF